MKKAKSKFSLLLLFLVTISNLSQAQLTGLPSGGNKKAIVGERVGITDITIEYSRPGVKGREGQIWGKLIPIGFNNLGFGSAKESPWRAGANENTTIQFSTDVKIEGKDLPEGKYGFFIVYSPDECSLIFSKNSSSWGSYYYDPSEDALRVAVKPFAIDKSVERMKYEFTDQTENSATIALQWEKLMIPFKVEVDYVKTQLASFHKELRGERGFTWESWTQAAQWCADHNTNLNEALIWTDSSINPEFGGDQTFQAWNTRAQVLEKLGKTDESTSTMKKALPFGNEFEIHQYARKLLTAKKYQEAFEVCKLNYDKHPGDFITNIGMARAYSGLGNYKKALEFAKKAQPLATDQANKANLEKMIKTLEEGKDINS